MKIGYTVLGNTQVVSEEQLCKVLSQPDCFANKRIDFTNKNQPVLKDKTHGYFNPINRWWFAENTVTFDHKKTVITNLGNILRRYSQGIAADELTQKVDKCSGAAIAKNLQTLEKKFLKGANAIQKQMLTPLFAEVYKNLKLGKEVNAYQSTVPIDPKATKITIEQFFDLLQKREGLNQKLQILKDGSIYIRDKEKQGWIFKRPAEAAAAKIATAQMVCVIAKEKAVQANLKDEKKYNLPAICNRLKQIETKMVRNTTESEALAISRPLTDAIVCLDELYRSMQEVKPTLARRAYDATTQVATDAALFVPLQTWRLGLYLLKGGGNLALAGAYSLAGRVNDSALSKVRFGGVGLTDVDMFKSVTDRLDAFFIPRAETSEGQVKGPSENQVPNKSL